MSENSSNIYVIEWNKQPNSKEYDLKVTVHNNVETALKQAQTSTSEQHCVSTVNPLTGEGQEKR